MEGRMVRVTGCELNYNIPAKLLRNKLCHTLSGRLCLPGTCIGLTYAWVRAPYRGTWVTSLLENSMLKYTCSSSSSWRQVGLGYLEK